MTNILNQALNVLNVVTTHAMNFFGRGYIDTLVENIARELLGNMKAEF